MSNPLLCLGYAAVGSVGLDPKEKPACSDSSTGSLTEGMGQCLDAVTARSQARHR